MCFEQRDFFYVGIYTPFVWDIASARLCLRLTGLLPTLLIGTTPAHELHPSLPVTTPAHELHPSLPVPHLTDELVGNRLIADLVRRQCPLQEQAQGYTGGLLGKGIHSLQTELEDTLTLLQPSLILRGNKQ